MRTVVLVALAIGLLVSWCDADLEATAEEAAATDDDSQLTEEEEVEENLRNLTERINPHYEREMKQLIDLCRLIGSEMKDRFLLRNQLGLERNILLLAATLGQHLDEAHGAWLEGHKSWTCAQAREAMKHEHVTNFLDGFDRWYSTESAQHNRTIELVQHLHDEMAALRLMNEDTARGLSDIVEDLRALELWHVALRDHYSEMMHEANSRNCEVPFQKFMTVLTEIHANHVPEWNFITEGITLMWQQCQEDPEIRPHLTSSQSIKT